MPEILATVTFEAVTGFPDDNVVNTFAIAAPGAALASADADNIRDHLADFYNVAGAGGFSINQFLSPVLKRTANAVTVRMYDVADHLDGVSNYGSPVQTRTFTLAAAAAADPLPDEVALCLTLKSLTRDSEPVETPDGGDPGVAVDRPMQRHTGRIYVGPFNAGALSNPDGKCRPNANLRTAVLDAAEDMEAAMTAEALDWSIWSRRDADFRSVAGVFVDNAFDIQRRRGTAPTIRSERDLGV